MGGTISKPNMSCWKNFPHPNKLLESWAPGRLQWPDHPRLRLLLAAQDCSSLSPQLLWGPLDHQQVLSQCQLCSDVGESTLPKAFMSQDGVSSTAGSPLGQPCPSCSLAPVCCFREALLLGWTSSKNYTVHTAATQRQKCQLQLQL